MNAAIVVENGRSLKTLAGALLTAGILTSPGERAALRVDLTSLTCSHRLCLRNASTAALSDSGSKDEVEVELESPNFVPAELLEFAATGFERRNRWS